MAEESDTETENREKQSESSTVGDVDSREEVILDVESAQEYEDRIDELTETVEQQREELQELRGLLTDLSTRVADDKAMGVCPECHGPVQKVRRFFRRSTIECRRCGEVYHEY